MRNNKIASYCRPNDSLQFAEKVGCIIARQGGVGVQRPMPAPLRSALHCIRARLSQSVGDDALALSYALIHNMHRCRAARVALVGGLSLPSAHFRANSATTRHWAIVLEHQRPWSTPGARKCRPLTRKVRNVGVGPRKQLHLRWVRAHLVFWPLTRWLWGFFRPPVVTCTCLLGFWGENSQQLRGCVGGPMHLFDLVPQIFPKLRGVAEIWRRVCFLPGPVLKSADFDELFMGFVQKMYFPWRLLSEQELCAIAACTCSHVNCDVAPVHTPLVNCALSWPYKNGL